MAATRLASIYLGNARSPLLAIVSGLTDADAIALSISNLQRNGLVTLDWANINLVPGALSGTCVQLALALYLDSRALFRQFLERLLAIGAVGIATMPLYYDLGALTRRIIVETNRAGQDSGRAKFPSRSG